MAAKRYYVRIRGKVLGPFDVSQLRRQRARGQLGRFHELSEDRVHWLPAAEVPELFPVEESTPPPEAAAVPSAPPGAGDGGAGGAPPAPAVWHYLSGGGKEMGPVASEQLLDLMDEGVIGPRTLVWNASLIDWVPLESAPGLLADAPAPRRRGGRTSLLALASLVAAVVWVGGVGSAAAVVLGLLALREIGRHKGTLRGRGLALAGVMVGGAGLALALLVGAGMVLYFAAKW